MEYCIGVDSGGTHMTGMALSLTGKQLAQVEAGSGNVFMDEKQAVANLTKVISSLLEKLSGQACRYILLGIAGVETAGNAVELATLFSKKFACPTYVISDAKLALLNGLQGQEGTLVIAGTGSVVYGRQAGQFMRFGGWGPKLGDTGSAYKIAEAAMKQCLWRHDLGEVSQLEKTLLATLDCPSLSQAVLVYNKLDRTTIASLAKDVGKLAEAGNVEAQQILQDQAGALAKEVLGLLHRYQDPRPLKVAVSGSVLVKNQYYRESLQAQLKTEFPQLEVFPVSKNNAEGAIYWPLWQKK